MDTITVDGVEYVRKDQTESDQEIRLITPRQAAAILGCHHKTLLRWVLEGRVRGIKFSQRRIRFSKREILDFAASGVDHKTERP